MSPTQRIRRLSQALMISGGLNIAILSIFLYWTLRERPPMPYCELKPATLEQRQVPLADHRGLIEAIEELSRLSFSDLVGRLSHTCLIESGYAERDLALAALIAFHHFDIERALPKDMPSPQKRQMLWRPQGQAAAVSLTVYPDLAQKQFDGIIRFAQTERWPFTAERLFVLLKNQKGSTPAEDSLAEAFMLSQEFWTVELLFSRPGQPIVPKELLTLLLEGDWSLLKSFTDQQRIALDRSDARRQKFLLDYLQVGAPSAAAFLLKIEWEFSVKKLNDLQVMAIMRHMPGHLPESGRFAREMLQSPRRAQVWQQASQWLYAQAGEAMPMPWSYVDALARFIPQSAPKGVVNKEKAPVIKPALKTSTSRGY